MKRLSLLLVTLAAFTVWLTPGTAHAQSMIVDNGVGRAQIVIAEDPPRMVRLAADELQAYVREISGAQLPITTDLDEARPLRIYVGTSEHTDKLGISDDGLAHGAFRMVSGDDWLALVGQDADFALPEPWAHSRADRTRVTKEWDEITGQRWRNPMLLVHKSFHEPLGICEYDRRGSLNAVYAYLRSLGVRWYLPGEAHEVVPSRSSLTLPKVDRVVRPDFPVRFMRFWNRWHVASSEEVLWQLRLGLSPGTETAGMAGIGHGTVNVHAREQVRRTHPEYYAMWRGRATSAGGDKGKPCLSSEELLKQNVKYARAVLDHYDEPWVAVMPADGYSVICQCQLCEGRDTPARGYRGRLSDYAWDYVNRVAKELYKSHPDKKLVCFAYGTYLKPPEQIDKLSPNVVVGFCQWRSMFFDDDTKQNMRDLRHAWREKMNADNRQVIWEYYLHDRPDAYGWEAVPAVFPRLIADDLRALQGRSYGDYIEVYREHKEEGWLSIATNHLNIYTTARLYWDADRDVDAMLSEYYRRFYGPASDEAAAFFEFCQNNWFKMKSDVETIDRMFELLNEARSAAGDTVYGERLDLIAEFTAPLKNKRETVAKAGEKEYVTRTNVPRVKAEIGDSENIVIDGKLGDAFWRDNGKYMLMDTVTGARPEKNRTIIKIGWADDALYFAIRCYDQDMKNLNVTAKEDGDMGLWFGDSIDILLETHQHAYYQIGISPAGAVVDADRTERVDVNWSSGVKVGTQRYEDRWTAEVRIPIVGPTSGGTDPLQGVDDVAVDRAGVPGSKPSSEMPWFFNVCRQRVRGGGQKQLQAFSPTGTDNFHVREKFGELYVK